MLEKHKGKDDIGNVPWTAKENRQPRSQPLKPRAQCLPGAGKASVSFSPPYCSVLQGSGGIPACICVLFGESQVRLKHTKTVPIFLILFQTSVFWGLGVHTKKIYIFITFQSGTLIQVLFEKVIIPHEYQFIKRFIQGVRFVCWLFG